MADRVKKIIAALVSVAFFCALFMNADELPENEIQAALNGYFDNFRVNIFYPTLGFTKRISGSTSLSGRYLVDCITAASMRSRFDIDGVTSATFKDNVDGTTSASRRGGYSESELDEVRHELNAGLFHLAGEGSLSLNVLYSAEHDYRSWTLAGQASYPFAMKNTTVQIGLVRSWDRIFPDTRLWTRSKDVITASAGLTQVLSPKWIIQANLSATRMSGYLSDPYQPVPVFSGNTFIYHETVLPGERLRKAAGIRSNILWSQYSSIQIGYRYYLDDWDVRSHTANALVQWYTRDKNIILGLGMRHYTQQHADFFRTEYTDDEGFLTVDTKLNDLWSNEAEIMAEIKGSSFSPGSLLHSTKTVYTFSLGFYQRRTPTPDWFSGYKTLYAYTTSIGMKYHF